MELLISATLAVAARRGTIEPSVREILEQAGLSTKAFYRHFRSKDELLLVTLEEGCRVLAEYLEHRMSTVPKPLDKVGAWIDGFVRQAVNPSAARRTLPWTLGAGRLATVFPEQFDKNQARIMVPLRREIANAVKDGSGQSPDPARDARLIYGYTMDNVRYNLINDTRSQHPCRPAPHQLRPPGPGSQAVARFVGRLGCSPVVGWLGCRANHRQAQG